MKTLCDARENRATLRAGLVANGDGVVNEQAGLEDVEDGLRLVARNVDANFPHGFDDDWVQFARLKSCAHCFEITQADVIQERLSHLAARAVVDADEKDSFLSHDYDVALNWSFIGLKSYFGVVRQHFSLARQSV